MASATVFHYFLLFLVGSFLYLVFILIADVFGFVQNIFLSNFAGAITAQTLTCVNFVTGVIISAPFLIAITLFIWAIVRGASN